jgi:hypothetical protein
VLDLVALLEAEPQVRRVLERALEVESSPHPDTWIGWEWHEVGASTPTLRRLVTEGWVRVAYRSRAYTHYRLTDVAAIERALQASMAVREDVAAGIPPDLFEAVEGHDLVKRVLRLALEATRPVHVLLVGPPASAKSLLLDELARLPGSRLAVGVSTTRAGLTEWLLANPECRYLLIDEADQLSMRDASALLTVMESGRVVRLQHGRQESERRAVWVFAAANGEPRSAALRSRFVVCGLAPYRRDEYERAVVTALVRREGADPESARAIAHLVGARSRNVRDARSIWRLSNGNLSLARDLVREVL